MQNVELYSKNNNCQKSASRKFYNYFGDLLKAEFKNQEISLIDVGSGCGTILSEVTVGESGLKFAKIFGVDKSEKMVNFASETYGSDLMSFRYMDVIDKIPDDLMSEQFDMVTSFYCLHHVRDLKKAFETINGLLAVNGLFGCVFFTWHTFITAWDALTEKYPVMSNWRNRFTPLFAVDNPDEIIKNNLSESGFEIVKFIDDRNEFYNFSVPENMAKTLDAINPFFTSMSEEEQKQFSKDQMSKIFELQKSESLVEPFRVIYFVARKTKTCC
ncbi:unnamed protein product [Chironomus riparius]|uniref:Methyltransferase domain-containing protein n=1 Tax=Chironomus riparius TaxID=315576 RepID=A0A9N9S980_9DIPT|nr:unnamed protein product [Chironomus riparius]